MTGGLRTCNETYCTSDIRNNRGGCFDVEEKLNGQYIVFMPVCKSLHIIQKQNK